MLKRFILTTFILFLSNYVIAAEHRILKITSNGDPSYYYMGIMMDEENMNAIGMYKKEITEDGKEFRWNYTLEELRSKNGVVLVERSGCDVVRVKAMDVEPATGGQIKIIAKKNCIFGSTFTKDLEITRVSENQFDVFMEGAHTKHLFFKAGSVGLKDIIAK